MANVQRSAPSITPRASIDTWGELDHHSDLGVLARLCARAGALPSWLAALVALVLLGAALVVRGGGSPWWLVAAAVAFVPAAGCGWSPPLRGRLAWVLPSSLFALEVSVHVLVQQGVDPSASLAGVFAFIAAAAYRRYDVIYRIRDLGVAPPAWLRAATGGVEGRLLLVSVVAALAPHRLDGALLLAAGLLGVMVLAESTRAWVAWFRAAGRR